MDENAFDLTPMVGPLPKCQDFVMNEDIVRMIYTIYENVDRNWAGLHEEDAGNFFYGPNYPIVAISELGYPARAVDFNIPEEQEREEEHQNQE